MFVDKVQVTVEAGDGGNGSVSFRHEKFVDRGGPDGGDGGKGGDVILIASRNQNTLANFRFQKLLKAEDGEPGFKRKRHGKNGESLRVAVPVGTLITNMEGELLADLLEDGQETIIARGGQGGFGNTHFVSSRRQAPRIAEKGEPGDELEMTMELKMIADVGLVGMPNAGKSTLLASLSNARPEIANYPFTTIRPNLGMVEIDKQTTLLFADIPGLIEGASEGKGLGDDFLRHVERTNVLVHMIDIYNDDVAMAYTTIQDELKAYKINLTKRPQIVVLNKIDGMDEEIIADRVKDLKKVIPKTAKVYAISAQSKLGLQELLYAIKATVEKERAKQAAAQEAESKSTGVPVLRLDPVKEDSWHIKKLDNGYSISGRKIERFAAKTDFDNPAGVMRLRDIMRKMGIMNELHRQKVDPGTILHIGPYTLEY
jgi:GTP-binding protein